MKSNLLLFKLSPYLLPLCFLIGAGSFSPNKAQTTTGGKQIHWANKVIGYSSEYIEKGYLHQYAPIEALGTPSINYLHASPAAWCSSTENNPGGEWINLGFEPTVVSQIIINENFNPGAIAKVTVYGVSGEEKTVYQNANAQAKVLQEPLFFIDFPTTTFKVKSVKIDLATDHVEGFNQIDAVGISPTKTEYKIPINTLEEFTLLAQPENLGAKINSAGSELLPVISPDGKYLFVTRQGHPQNIGKPEFQDAWVAELTASGFGEAKNLGGPINNPENNAVIGISPDGQKLYLLNIYLPDGSMNVGVSYSLKEGENWGQPQRINVENYYNNNKYGEFAFANSGKFLICAIERDDTRGSKDLYVSFREGENKFSEPKNITFLNTADTEISPNLSSDEKTLYFASKGRPGYGGADMFVSTRLDDTWMNWTEPINLGPVLNTASFDAYYSIPASGDYIYFSSYTNSLGEADIFRVKLPPVLQPKPVTLVSGKVIDAKTRKPIQAKIMYENLKTQANMGEALSNEISGKYSIVLPGGINYGFQALAEGYYAISDNLDLTQLKAYEEIQKDLLMVKIEKGEVIRLNNLFFDTGKFSLRPESVSELQRLKTMMDQNPTMQIEIQGHTDSDGQEESNQILSENRAKAVYDEILKAGVQLNRLKFKGFGEIKPVANNDTPANKQLNRRVEFLIVEK